MHELLAYSHISALLKASWQAAVLILLVLALQWALGSRLGPRWRYSLWLLVLVRLALPWTVPSSASLFNLLGPPGILRPEPATQAVISPPDPPVSQPDSTPEEPSGDNDLAAGLAGAAPGHWAAVHWMLLLWGAGAAVLGLCIARTQYRLSRRVTRCRPLIDAPVMNLLEDCKQLMGVHVPVALVETAEVGSPALFGFVRPRLLLPVGLARDFSKEELRYVFLHELAHIKRNDILTGWLMMGLQILHWFNPLVWLAFYRMRLDRELACDAVALRYAREEESQPYGRTIIKLLEDFARPAWAPGSAGVLENKNQMKERISMIAKYNRTNRGLGLAAVLLSGLGLATLTDAKPGQTGGGPSAPGRGSIPHIVSTSPKIGAKDVEPTLKEITVTFDCDMDAGFSWTGGGPEYPPIPEGQKPRWRDKRTCVLPVKLESGHFYRVGINSTSYRNFRSAAGVSAPTSAIYFTTTGASTQLTQKTKVPTIVSLTPPNGAGDVSPGLTELRVTFDVPMGAGCSWTGSGPHFPAIPEGKRPHWTEDQKTCVLPVELKPGWDYELGINSLSHKNFQSAAGVPSEPVVYKFKTGEK